MPDRLVERALVACADLLPRVDSAYLDCVADDLALVLAAQGVADVRSPFAQDWRFDLVDGPRGLPVLDLPPADQNDLLAERTGWRPRWRPVTSIDNDLSLWWQALLDGSAVILVGDAYFLPWVPYQGHEHMDHGFVLEGLESTDDGVTAHLVDPYDNATQWGRATPQSCRLPVEHLADALAGGRWAVLEPAPAAASPTPRSVLRANATAVLAAGADGRYGAFIASHEPLGLAELENLTMQTWLLARNRGLHARWLAGLDAATVDASLARQFADHVAAGWQRASEMSYVALRRVRSGRPAPTGPMSSLRTVADDELRMAGTMLAASDVA